LTHQLTSAIFNSVFLSLLISGVQIRTTLFAFCAFLDEGSQELGFYEPKANDSAKVDLILDVNSGRVLSVDCLRPLAVGTLEAVAVDAQKHLPDIKKMLVTFLENNLKDRIA